MPSYDFKCTSCNHTDEVFQKMSDTSTKECPNCKNNTFSKQISAPSFHLKGGGYYQTDFKTKSSHVCKTGCKH